VYVDDLVVTGPDNQQVSAFIQQLCSHFDCRDLGPLSFFLGMHAVPKPGGLFLSQTRYATELLSRFGMATCSPVSTPLPTGPLPRRDEGELYPNPTVYRQMVGGLQYLTLTRPDLAYAVNFVSRFLAQPRIPHLKLVKRIFRYVKGTLPA
jgi:hypothetical protein